MNEIEFLVISTTEINAVKALSSLGVSKSEVTGVRGTLGGYMVRVSRETVLSDKEYQLVLSNADLAIHKDSESDKRAEEIFNATREVEIKLRELFLYVAPEIDSLFTIPLVSNGKGKRFKSPTRKGLLDPFSSQYTFEGIVEIFSFDLMSLDSQVDYKKLSKIANDSKDFESFQKALENNSKPKLIWSLLGMDILKKSIEWSNIGKELRTIIDYRNTASHHRVITPAYRKKALRHCAKVSQKLEIKPDIVTRSVLNYTDAWQSIIDNTADNLARIYDVLNVDALTNMRATLNPLGSNMLAMKKAVDAINNSMPVIDFLKFLPNLPYGHLIDTDKLLVALDTITPSIAKATESAHLFMRVNSSNIKIADILEKDTSKLETTHNS